VSVTDCVIDQQTYPGAGTWEVRIQQRAVAGVEQLAVALRLPDAPTPTPTICLQVGSVFVVTLTDAAGDQFMPLLPSGQCGVVLPQVLTAWHALRWVTVSAERIEDQPTALSSDSGCPDLYRPILAGKALTGRGTPAPSDTPPAQVPWYGDPTHLPVQVRACWYQPDTTVPLTVTAGHVDYGERLTGTAIIDGSRLSTLAAALARAPAAPACPPVDGPLVMLDPRDANDQVVGEPVVVAIGGCDRFEFEQSVHQLTGSQASLLAPPRYARASTRNNGPISQAP
jgi:hypothetical protein